MTRVARSIACGVAMIASALVARRASAQVMCNDTTMLPNPIIVTGSNTFEPMVGQFAVKLAAEPTPASVIFATSAATSCAGIANVANATDLGGGPGRFYTLSGSSITRNDCTFAPGQKADVAVSDVFYETCADLPQPKPADLADVTGPVQATVFIVALQNTATQYLTSAEAQAIYGCGVSSTRAIAGFSDPANVFCRNSAAGPQVVLAKNLGLDPATVASPRCVNGGASPASMAGNVSASTAAIGFITADSLEGLRSSISPLAYQATGQARAYPLDSRTDFVDRQNVRDGHYTLWGYAHLIAKTAGGNPSRPAADFIAWVTGAKSNANVDHIYVAGRTGLIPQCAMRVKRSSDGGLLSPYTPPQSCSCAFRAAISKTIPPGCSLCSADSVCTDGTTCRHGFCE
jgi:ABC-type phosphate transport system substrate-binding protein